MVRENDGATQFHRVDRRRSIDDDDPAPMSSIDEGDKDMPADER